VALPFVRADCREAALLGTLTSLGSRSIQTVGRHLECAVIDESSHSFPRRDFLATAAALVSVGCSNLQSAISPSTGRTEVDPISTTDERSFDFFLGHWRAKNRRLAKHFQQSNDWSTFEASHHCVSLLDGLGNMDELRSDTHGLMGMSIRLFNRTSAKWHIWWVSSKDGILQPPVVGSFRNGQGVFEGHDELGGRPILVRFVWYDITPNNAKWQQAFSPDEGATWEVNWVMEFTRV
jgi:hypothetical protein